MPEMIVPKSSHDRFCLKKSYPNARSTIPTDSEIVMVDLAFGDDFFERNRSWDDFGTTISGIQGTHQNFIGSRMLVLLIIPGVDDKLGLF